MSVFRGDFLGFKLGDIHSSQLNITRVSNNDRYTENLTPVFKDQTTEVPGGDGLYYWNTSHTQQTFIIDFAFDDLRAEDIRRLRRVFSFKGVQELIFDETPYKKYMVKCQNPPTLKYIAFDVNGITIYKGEGTVNLVAYYPYGIDVNETILTPSKSNMNIAITNLGDLETPLKIQLPIDVDGITLTLNNEKDQLIGRMTLGSIPAQSNINYLLIDSKTCLIEGLIELTKTGILLNSYITSGDFFTLPPGHNTLNFSKSCEKKIKFYNLYY